MNITARKGFTLLELLVVIAIISLLAALLFPVFAHAKEAAKRTAEISQSKQIGLAVSMYNNDEDDTMPIFYAYNSDPSIYSPAVHHGTEVLLQAYSKNQGIFDSPLDSGGPYLSVDPGPMAKGANTYWKAYGTSYRFGHCMFTTVKDESSQNNSFQIYDPFQHAWDTTEIVNQSAVQFPAESRVIRVEMFPFFGPTVDPTCARYGYDCPAPYDYFQLWGNVGGSVIFDDGHAKSIVGCGIYDQEYVSPDGHRSNDSTTDPNAWTGTWYSICD